MRKLLSLAAALSLSSAAFAQTLVNPNVQQVQLLAPQLLAFAGSDANFQSLVNGLTQGTPVTLTTLATDGTLQIVLEDPTALDRSIRDEFVTIATDRGEYPEAARAYADAASSMFWYLVRNLDRDLGIILRTHPALMVFGDRDRLVHLSSAHALSARHPDLDVAILEGVGHAPQLEAPRTFSLLESVL